MHKPRSCQLAIAILILACAPGVVLAVSGSVPVASGTANSMGEALLTLPSGTQQTVDTRDRNGTVVLTPASGQAGRLNVNLNIQGNGLYLITDKASGATLATVPVFGDQIININDEAVLDSGRTDVTITTHNGSGQPVGARVDVTPLSGAADTRQEYTRNIGSEGNARIDQIRTNFYRITTTVTGSDGKTRTLVRYQLIRPGMDTVDINVDDTGNPVNQLLAWDQFFRNSSDTGGLAVIKNELARYSGTDIFNSLPQQVRDQLGGLIDRLNAATTKEQKLQVIRDARERLQRNVQRYGQLLDPDVVRQAQDGLNRLENFYNSPQFDASLQNDIRKANQTIQQRDSAPRQASTSGGTAQRTGSGTRTEGGGSTVSGDIVRQLPTIGRSFQDFAKLIPAVPAKDTINISGPFAYQNLFLIDGVQADAHLYGSNPTLFISDEFIKEIEAVTGGYSAEYGRFSGGVINVITKSGGNEVSGGVRLFVEDENWEQSQSPGFGADNPFLKDSYTATLGGYIVKDRLWFFNTGREVKSNLDKFNFVNNTRNSYYTLSSGEQFATLRPGYTGTFTPQAGFSFTATPDRLRARLDPGHLKSGAYTGILTPNLFAELQYSEKTFNFTRYGQRFTVNTDYAAIGDLKNWRGVAQPYFLQATGSSFFFGADQPYVNINSTIAGFNVSGDVLDAGLQHVPTGPFTPGSAATTPAGSNYQSYFVNDHWQLNDKWSFNIGFRYEDVGRPAGKPADSFNLGTEHSVLSGDEANNTYKSEFLGGIEFEVARSVSLGVRYVHRSIPRILEDAGTLAFPTFDAVKIGQGVTNPVYQNGFNFLAPGDRFIAENGGVSFTGLFSVENKLPVVRNADVYLGTNAFATGPCPDTRKYRFNNIFGDPGQDQAGEFFFNTFPVGNDCGFRFGVEYGRDDFVRFGQDSDFKAIIDEFVNYRPVPGFGKFVPNIVEWPLTAHVAAPAPQSKLLPNDTYFHSRGSFASGIDDQWGLKHIGFKASGRDGRGLLWPRRAQPVIVAVVDSGVDISHPDLQGQLWANFREIPNNNKDDDGNGLVDDIFGWNFVDWNNNVRDQHGHGTFVAGIIGATADNAIGIAGINPWARIMTVKVSNFAGNSNSIRIAMGISYAARMGARVINVSLSGKGNSKAIRAAVEDAVKRGALVVVAAGNEGVDVKDIFPGNTPGVINVAALNPRGERENYSNWGTRVDIAAPGSDILSLRASGTDLLQWEQKDYKRGSNAVGTILYHTSGTSFAAPHVAGVASLLLSVNPKLTAEQVKRMILNSATDNNVPGIDQFTGYGALDAAAALKADPDFFVDARVHKVGVERRDNKVIVQVFGTADANQFERAWVEIGQGVNPGEWKKAGAALSHSVKDGVVAEIPAAELQGAKLWTIKLVTQHKNGRKRENRFNLKLG